MCIISVRVKETYGSACFGKLRCGNFEPLELNEKHAEGKPPCEIRTLEIQAAVSGETFGEGLLFDEIVSFYMALFHPCFCWCVLSGECLLVMDIYIYIYIYANSTLDTIGKLKLLPWKHDSQILFALLLSRTMFRIAVNNTNVNVPTS